MDPDSSIKIDHPPAEFKAGRCKAKRTIQMPRKYKVIARQHKETAGGIGKPLRDFHVNVDGV